MHRFGNMLPGRFQFVLGVLATAALLALVTPTATAAAATVTRVMIDSGRLVGATSPHATEIAVFKGIPFAAPPVGELRWRPPQNVEAWSGVRSAQASGSPCWQPLVPETSLYSRGPMSVSEDCLYLNVWSGGAAGAAKLPVMVWYHGGSNTTGHGSSLIFDGANLARKGAVVVTVNYRMGPFGFFAHPELTAESAHHSSGNYALLDQIAALRWVQRNISAFGGDPARVMIFGQSAGALDVCLLMVSPLARDLLHGVIAHSGGCLRIEQLLESSVAGTGAHAAGLAIASELSTDPGVPASIAALRGIGPAEFVEGASRVGVPLARPIVDGWVIPRPPRELFMNGDYNHVPIIVGAMADEFRGLAADAPELSQAQYREQVQNTFPEHTDAIVAAYRTLSERSTREALWKLSTHSFFAWESRSWASIVSAAGGSAFVYHFSQPTAVFSLYIPERPEFPDPNGPRGLGAYHSGDLAYHFNNVGLVGLNWTPWDYELADTISSYWVNFARTGNPNGTGLPPWPAYARDADVVQEFGAEEAQVTSIEHPQHELLNVFDTAYDFMQ